MKCDMCGKKTTLYRAVIEDAELAVCADCGKFGKVIAEIRSSIAPRAMHKPIETGILQVVASDFSTRIKKKREQLKMTQEEFAHKLNEKTSIIQQLETGHMTPSSQLAQKFKKAFGLNLIEEYQEKTGIKASAEPDSFTLGDFIKTKKR